MTQAGWYEDPERTGVLRWWDGERWTDDWQPTGAPPPDDGSPSDDVLVHVQVGERQGGELVATTEHLTIKGETFALSDIDAVQYTAVQSSLNGAYMGISFTLQVRSGDRKQSFAMDSNHKNERVDEFGEAYGTLVALLDVTVCRRLAEEFESRLRAGETITLGPAGARVELTSEGFRLKKPLSKVVPWTAVTGTEVEGGRVFFLVRKKQDHEPKRHSQVGLDGDNMVVLPHLVQSLGSG